ncbi:MAG: hypothetical protein OXC31_23405 [Spirochaetaceae bacterium]|nr:hypothetical protein [Spirochaetaceae bacterium]
MRCGRAVGAAAFTLIAAPAAAQGGGTRAEVFLGGGGFVDEEVYSFDVGRGRSRLVDRLVTRRCAVLLRTVLMIALAAVPAAAQPVDSFRELAELLEIGRSVVVITSPSGDVITGQLVDISPASLSVFAGGRRIELDEARVRRVRQGWNDPIADGAVLGFAVGATPWLLAAFIGTGSEEASQAPPALTGLAGALIGATLDSLRSERLRDLYVREPRRMAISPLVSRERVGAALSISW